MVKYTVALDTNVIEAFGLPAELAWKRVFHDATNIEVIAVNQVLKECDARKKKTRGKAHRRLMTFIAEMRESENKDYVLTKSLDDLDISIKYMSYIPRHELDEKFDLDDADSLIIAQIDHEQAKIPREEIYVMSDDTLFRQSAKRYGFKVCKPEDFAEKKTSNVTRRPDIIQINPSLLFGSPRPLIIVDELSKEFLSGVYRQIKELENHPAVMINDSVLNNRARKGIKTLSIFKENAADRNAFFYALEKFSFDDFCKMFTIASEDCVCFVKVENVSERTISAVRVLAKADTGSSIYASENIIFKSRVNFPNDAPFPMALESQVDTSDNNYAEALYTSPHEKWDNGEVVHDGGNGKNIMFEVRNLRPHTDSSIILAIRIHNHRRPSAKVKFEARVESFAKVLRAECLIESIVTPLRKEHLIKGTQEYEQIFETLLRLPYSLRAALDYAMNKVCI